jgi:hypothetical protein
LWLENFIFVCTFAWWNDLLGEIFICAVNIPAWGTILDSWDW